MLQHVWCVYVQYVPSERSCDRGSSGNHCSSSRKCLCSEEEEREEDEEEGEEEEEGKERR